MSRPQPAWRARPHCHRFQLRDSSMMTTSTLPTNKMANAIRALAMDAVQKANSGHPGMPMGMAEIAVALWSGHYSHNPANPKWLNRDRFLLSNGHGSMLHYALLHLTGYDLSMDDIKAFSQMHSKTPGHPEVDVTPASKRPPARWARASPTRSAWRCRNGCWRLSSTSRALTLLTTLRTRSWAMAA